MSNGIQSLKSQHMTKAKMKYIYVVLISCQKKLRVVSREIILFC